MTTVVFDREQLRHAISLLAERLEQQGVAARITIIGGAAISLGEYYDRQATVDVDAIAQPRAEVMRVADELAEDLGWAQGWFNDRALAFVPNGWDRRGMTFHDEGDVQIVVAPPEALLAMKLNAGRPGRDIPSDVDQLLDACELNSVEATEELFDRYYPNELMKPRVLAHLNQRFSNPSP